MTAPDCSNRRMMKTDTLRLRPAISRKPPSRKGGGRREAARVTDHRRRTLPEPERLDRSQQARRRFGVEARAQRDPDQIQNQQSGARGYTRRQRIVIEAGDEFR